MQAQLDIGTLMALVTMAALLIDRVASGILLLLSLSKRFPDPSTGRPEQRARAEKVQRLAAWGVAVVLSAVVVVMFKSVRILAALDMQPANSFLDAAFTIVVLAGGSDFVGSLLRIKGGSSVPLQTPKPLEVTGRLVLGEYAEEKEKKALTQAA